MATSLPVEETTNSSLRRLACDACRARKVRCDRQDPPCSRCAKVGNTCRYSSRSKPTPSKMDLSRFLVTLNNRLRQAEAQLATNQMLQTSQPFAAMSWNDVAMSWNDVAMDMGPPGSSLSTASPQSSSPRAVTPPQLGSGHASVLGLNVDKAASEWPHQLGGCETSDFQFDLFPTPMSSENLMGQHTAEGTQAFPFDSMFVHNMPTPAASSSPCSPVSPGLLQGLYNRYFEIFHPIMPIINRPRFQAEISHPFAPPEIQALAGAVAALGALSVPDLRCYVDRCYEQARNLLDVCERQESGEALLNVNVLQACALLTLFEFKKPNFARAWMTLGRGIRLAKMMGFGGGVKRCLGASWGAKMQLPVVKGTGGVEESRRAFWVLYVFDAFSSLRTSTGLSFAQPMHVPLPSHSEYPESGPDMPSLHQVFDGSDTGPSLSSFAGTTIMISLYQRCFEHIQSSQHEPSHAFWETHYSIDKALAHCRTSVMIQHMNNTVSTINNNFISNTTPTSTPTSTSSVCAPGDQDPISLAIRMNIAAIEVSLHEAALAKVEREKLPAALAAEAASKCMAAAAEIVGAVQLGRRLADRRADIFQQLDQFLVWPLTTAIQVCFRALFHGDADEVHGVVAMLDVLVRAMRDLIDPDHIAPGLLEKAEASVAEAQTAKKRGSVVDE